MPREDQGLSETSPGSMRFIRRPGRNRLIQCHLSPMAESCRQHAGRLRMKQRSSICEGNAPCSSSEGFQVMQEQPAREVDRVFAPACATEFSGPFRHAAKFLFPVFY